MSSIGHRPTLTEILRILDMCTVTVATELKEGKWEFHIVWDTGDPGEEVEDWSDGLPKPTWLFEEIKEHLRLWHTQRRLEEEWISKEPKYGSSIDSLIVYFTDEMKKLGGLSDVPSGIKVRILAETILRLKELKERRAAGGVPSDVEDRREKARKTWAENEFEDLKREAEQAKRQQEHTSTYGNYEYESSWYAGPENWSEAQRETRNNFEEFIKAKYGEWGAFGQRNVYKQPQNSTAWHTILGVSVNATKKEIQTAHRKLAAKYHPDRYKGEDGHTKMAEINTARDEGLAGAPL